MVAGIITRTKLGNGKARLVGIDLLETDGLLGLIFLLVI